MRHNNIRDFESNLIRKVCNDVETEPSLQPINGENVTGLTGDEAKPDVRARGDLVRMLFLTFASPIRTRIRKYISVLIKNFVNTNWEKNVITTKE